jgi:hypothetical protein
MREQINLGKWTQEALDILLQESSSIHDTGRRIGFLSAKFLGSRYAEATLTGHAHTPEVFVINLEGVDCFTFIDHIEAMRISGSFSEFRENLKKIRYRSGKIVYENRNHFFTDWIEYNSDLIDDITARLSKGKSAQVKKILNQKDDGTCFLSGVSFRERQIVYIPSGNVDDAVINGLKTGDYIGIYSEKQGLDVSHIGIVIKDASDVFFRHASTKSMKVVDEDFRKYISGIPGIIVLRSK